MGRDTPVQVTHRSTIQHQRTGEHVSWHARCTCGRYTRFDTLTSAEQWATTHGDTMTEQPAPAPAPDGSRGDGMTRRIIVIDTKGAVYGHSTDLPAMQPGDSVRVTMTDDGGFDVAPLRHAGTRRLDDGMGGTIGPCRPSTVIDLWADAPEQGHDR